MAWNIVRVAVIVLTAPIWIAVIVLLACVGILAYAFALVADWVAPDLWNVGWVQLFVFAICIMGVGTALAVFTVIFLPELVRPNNSSLPAAA